MAASRRTRRRREQKSLQRHQLRLEGLEKRYALNAAPVLDPSASPQLDSVIEDAGIPVGQVGTLVSDLIDTGGTHDNFSDADGDLPGIAITGTNLQGGALWYSSDNGSTWLDIGGVSGEAPRLLAADATNRIYFEPAEDFTGTVSDVITIRAWDRNIEWMQLGLDIGGEAEGDQSGHKMSLSSDGQTVAIGAFRNNGNGFESGHVRIYRQDPLNNAWAQVGADIDGEAEGDRSGMAVSLSSDGQIVAIGAPQNDGNGNGSGHVRVYQYDSGNDTWDRLGVDIDGEAAGDFSGIYVSTSSNGHTLAIGATGNDGNGNKSGHVRIYQYDNVSNIWSQLGSDIDGESADDRQATVSLSADGRTVAVGAQYNDGSGNNAGRVRIYRYVSSTTSWEQLGSHIDGETAENQFGHWPALSADGQTVAVGAHFNNGNGLNSGHTRVYEYDAANSAWMQLGSDIDGEAEGDQSGHKLSLSADGRTIAISAFLNDGNGTHSGHVRLYEYDLSSENWEQIGPDIDGKSAGDQLGESVSLSGDGRTVAIGAHGNDDNGVDSGHVQIFQVEPTISQFAETISITVNPVNDIPLGEVTIDGEPTQNVVLSANTSTIQDEDGLGEFAYQWLRDGTPISGANSSTHTLTQLDVGTQISVRVDYTDNESTAESLTSAQTSAVVNVNDAPVLNTSASPQLNSVIENAGVPVGQVGTLVSDLIDVGGTHNNFSDIDGDLPGIAITGTNLQGGTLYYSTDDGATWNDVDAIAESSPRLLLADAATRLYYKPSVGFNGSISNVITIRGWDRNAEWRQLGSDIDGEAADDWSGWSVSSSSDGEVVAIGGIRNDDNGSDSGHVRIYKWSGSAWEQMGGDVNGEAAGDQSGRSVFLSGDGQTLAVGAHLNDGNGSDSGHVRIYKWSGSAWEQMGGDMDGEASSDRSGQTVSLSSDGEIMAVGARYNASNGNNSGHARIYRWSGSEWEQMGGDIAGEFTEDYSGFEVSLSSDGQNIAIGAILNDENGSDSGHVRIYKWSGSAWEQMGGDINGEAAGDRSGWSVSLSSNGNSVAIGAILNDGNGSDSGNVRIYKWSGSAWEQMGGDIDGEAAGDRSGWSVSLAADGRKLAISAISTRDSDSGYVRVYRWDESAWVRVGTDIDGEAAGDESGSSISLSPNGQTLVVGARFNNSNGLKAGHTRIFRMNPDTNSVSVNSETVGVEITPVNDEPTLNALSDININEDDPEQVINLTSISAGIGEAQELRVTAISSNTNLIPNPTIDYTSPNSTGSLIFTPVPGENGTASITVTLEDAGLDNNFNTTEDNRQATYQFEVNVFEVISKSDSATLAKDGLGNLYVNTYPVTYKEQQAQTNINGFAAIGASSEDGENALLVERSSVRYRLVADESWRINGLFHSLHNESSLPLNRLDRWVTMFNGQDLSGWRANSENPDSFRVENGVLVVDGGRSHLFWIGDPENPEDEELTNFHWHAKVKTMPNANSGLYFHTQYQESGWPSAGYEAQVNQTAVDRRKTGGLYAIADVLDTSPVEDGEWYTYDIIVDGKRIVLKINGVVTTDWTEPDDWQPPQHMLGRKLSQGTVAIQAHDPESIVHYKDIRIKRLP